MSCDLKSRVREQPPTHLQLLYFSWLVAVHLMALIYQTTIESSAGLCVKKKKKEKLTIPFQRLCVIHEMCMSAWKLVEMSR